MTNSICYISNINGVYMKIKFSKHLSIAAVMMFTMIATPVMAQSKDEIDVGNKLKKAYPSMKYKKITFLPEVSLYEVRLDDPAQTLSYTNKAVEFFLVAGEIVDPKSKTNVSSERALVNVEHFYKSLNFDNAITFKYGKGTRHIAVFTDPDCPFCKSLDAEIHNKLSQDDLTVHYFFNPLLIAGHEQAPLKAAKIWCAPNRNEAYKAWMLNGILPSNDGSCKNPVAETKEFSTKVGFNSTPVIVFDSGHIARNALSAENLRLAIKDRVPSNKP